MIEMYGISNCDTIKKARKWLTQADINYQFHDFKKEPLQPEKLENWLKLVDWQILLNKRGMMWRKLSQQEKDQINLENATRIMLATNSIIKRPIIEFNQQLHVGFKNVEYQKIFQE